MFWDNVAGVYYVFVNVINRETHQKLKEIVSDLIEPDDTVLECACRSYPQTVLKEFKGLAHAELVMMFPERFANEVKRYLEE